MKRIAAITILLIVCAFASFALTNNMQKIYPTTSEEYQVIKFLYIAQGHSLPSTTGPWSADELAEMLLVIDKNNLDNVQRSMYDKVADALIARPEVDLDKVGFNFNGYLTLEMYAHTNTDGYERTARTGGSYDSEAGVFKPHYITEKAFQGNHWIYNERDQQGFLNFELETFATDHFYALFQGTVANSWHSDDDYTEELGVSSISTNIIGLKHLKFNLAYFDGNWPYRAFLSTGGENWNIQIGRDRLSWGPGESGNLAISDNMPWQNYGKITTYSKDFKYTFLVSFFPHPVNYWDAQSDTYDATNPPRWHGLDNSYWSNGAYRGLSMYIGHRFEIRFLNDKFTFAATEGLMYMSEDNTIDVRALNPLNFNHNNYIARNSNSTLELEFNYTPINGLNVYGEMIVDEIAFPGIETPPSETERKNPTAMGFLAGVKGVFTLGNGIFHAYAEFAKTDPYLYLRDGVHSNGTTGEAGYYGLNYVVALRNWSSVGAGITYDEYFLGYTYGPDAVVANVKAGWTTADLKLSVEGSFFFMAHGTHDAWTMWTPIGGDDNYQYDKASPTEKHTSYNAKYAYKTGAMLAVENTVVCGVNASYKVLDWLTVMAQADFINIQNYGNIPDAPDQNDFQFVLSARITF